MSNIRLDPEGRSFVPGEMVTCKADGYPQPTFQWIRTSDNVTVQTGAELKVESANYSYICSATNKVRERTYIVMSAEISFGAEKDGNHQQFSVIDDMQTRVVTSVSKSM